MHLINVVDAVGSRDLDVLLVDTEESSKNETGVDETDEFIPYDLQRVAKSTTLDL